MKEVTDVIFRKFPDGDVIALFPREPGSCHQPWTCLSYMKVGQHGSASVNLTLAPAKPEEYVDLKAELESLGYVLRIRHRFSQADWKVREQKLKN